jgi:hypothetical protein
MVNGRCLHYTTLHYTTLHTTSTCYYQPPATTHSPHPPANRRAARLLARPRGNRTHGLCTCIQERARCKDCDSDMGCINPPRTTGRSPGLSRSCQERSQSSSSCSDKQVDACSCTIVSNVGRAPATPCSVPLAAIATIHPRLPSSGTASQHWHARESFDMTHAHHGRCNGNGNGTARCCLYRTETSPTPRWKLGPICETHLAPVGLEQQTLQPSPLSPKCQHIH